MVSFCTKLFLHSQFDMKIILYEKFYLKPSSNLLHLVAVISLPLVAKICSAVSFIYSSQTYITVGEYGMETW